MAIYFFVNYIIHNQQLGLGESINFNRGWYSFCLKHLCNLLTNWSPVCWTSVDSVLCLECYAMYNVSNVVQCLSNIPRMLPLCYVIALLLCSARNGPVRHLKLNWIPSKTCGEFFLPVSTVMCLSWAACGRWSHSAGCDVIAPRLDRAQTAAAHLRSDWRLREQLGSGIPCFIHLSRPVSVEKSIYLVSVVKFVARFSFQIRLRHLDGRIVNPLSDTFHQSVHFTTGWCSLPACFNSLRRPYLPYYGKGTLQSKSMALHCACRRRLTTMRMIFRRTFPKAPFSCSARVHLISYRNGVSVQPSLRNCWSSALAFACEPDLWPLVWEPIIDRLFQTRPKNDTDLGFEIEGGRDNYPNYISRVKSGSAAENKGIKRGRAILYC